MKNYLKVVLVFSSFFSFSAFAQNCQEVRMGLDIGSGSTKVLVAKIDFCQKKILEVLHNESRKVSYNEDLEKSADGRLSPSIVDNGQSILKEFISKGMTFKPKKSYGVATSVFRKAKNGAEVIKSFSKKLKIPIKVITQEEEAMLGFHSAAAEVGETNVVVWDIGGGSMQIIGSDKDNKTQMYLGDLASVTYKNMVVEVVQSKSLDSNTSPNPIGDKREQAVALSRSYARIHVPAAIKSMIKDRVVVGVGGVHGSSLKNQMQLKETKYTLEELSQAGKTQSKKSDSELVGDYRSTDVTNLLLVQGFMEAMGIKEVRIANASLLQGLLLQSETIEWKSRK